MLIEKTSLGYWVQELQGTLQEFLQFLTDLYQIQTIPAFPDYLSVVDTLLHILTDVETQLSYALAALERERLIHYYTFMKSKDRLGMHNEYCL
ncbi:MAG: hypothetical protein ACFFB5_05645 [Promethearchaeota archaeon]